METKICKKCNEEKNISEYHIHKKKDSVNYYRNICKVCFRKSNLNYINTEEIKIKKKQYSKEYLSKLEVKNRKKIINKEYYLNNSNKINERLRTRRIKEPLYKLKVNLRRMLKASLDKHGFAKKSKTEHTLGCSYVEFKLYLESKFESWMNWDNCGKYEIDKYNIGWDIDHIIPLFAANSEEELLKLNHYTNLQPLCSKVNRDDKKAKFNP